MVRKVVTALALGAGAVDVLDRQRVAHLAEMRRLLAEQSAATDVSTRIVLDHAVSHLDADHRCLETSADRIRTTQGALR
jgi:hypothetical protein